MHLYDWRKARYLNYVFSLECLIFRFFLIQWCEDFDLYSEAESVVCSTSARGLISRLDPDSTCPMEFMLRFESRLLEFVTSNS